jgi:hypothetical protein
MHNSDAEVRAAHAARYDEKGSGDMRTLLLAVTVGLVTAVALPPLGLAEGSSCTTTASDKKLAGAAKTSFMKKCETDAKAGCDATAADKKLAGAAKASFTKKCVSDSVGS